LNENYMSPLKGSSNEVLEEKEAEQSQAQKESGEKEEKSEKDLKLEEYESQKILQTLPSRTSNNPAKLDF